MILESTLTSILLTKCRLKSGQERGVKLPWNFLKSSGTSPLVCILWILRLGSKYLTKHESRTENNFEFQDNHFYFVSPCFKQSKWKSGMDSLCSGLLTNTNFHFWDCRMHSEMPSKKCHYSIQNKTVRKLKFSMKTYDIR